VERTRRQIDLSLRVALSRRDVNGSARRCHMAQLEPSKGGVWLRILSGLIIVLVAVALLYAVVIGLVNFQRIGV
jgi:nitric oxide reductase large subunit